MTSNFCRSGLIFMLKKLMVELTTLRSSLKFIQFPLNSLLKQPHKASCLVLSFSLFQKRKESSYHPSHPPPPKMIITFCLEAICFLPDLRFLIKISGGFILLLWSKLVVSFKKGGTVNQRLRFLGTTRIKNFSGFPRLTCILITVVGWTAGNST